MLKSQEPSKVLKKGFGTRRLKYWVLGPSGGEVSSLEFQGFGAQSSGSGGGFGVEGSGLKGNKSFHKAS